MDVPQAEPAEAPQPVRSIWKKFEPAIPRPPRPDEEEETEKQVAEAAPKAKPAERPKLLRPPDTGFSDSQFEDSAREKKTPNPEDKPLEAKIPPGKTPLPEEEKEQRPEQAEPEERPAQEEVAKEPEREPEVREGEEELDGLEDEKPKIQLVRSPLPRFAPKEETTSETKDKTQHPFSPARRRPTRE